MKYSFAQADEILPKINAYASINLFTSRGSCDVAVTLHDKLPSVNVFCSAHIRRSFSVCHLSRVGHGSGPPTGWVWSGRVGSDRVGSKNFPSWVSRVGSGPVSKNLINMQFIGPTQNDYPSTIIANDKKL